MLMLIGSTAGCGKTNAQIDSMFLTITWLNRYNLHGATTAEVVYALICSVALFCVLFVIAHFVDRGKNKLRQ
jgi:hypothetical protein